MPRCGAQRPAGAGVRVHAGAAGSGFTLFEVMAAVLVLGILYSVLATTAIEGLRAEGESKRRLEASLLVDEQLMELESGLDAGVFPEIGVEESEIDDYHVLVEITPFDITPFLGEEYQEQQSGAGGRSGGGATSLLAPADHPEESLLRLVSVVVSWDEPGGVHEVRRLTLAYDQNAVEALLPAAGEAAPQAPEGESDMNLESMLQMLEGAR